MKASSTYPTVELLEPRIAPAAVFVNRFTASYTDTDGDHVTVHFTRPILTSSNVSTLLVTAPSGLGDQLQAIDLSSVTAAARGTGISVTAKVGASGDGFVNVGAIKAAGVSLGAVSVHGDLGQISAGNGNGAALRSLSTTSLGLLGTTTGATSLFSFLQGSVGTLAVKTDVLGAKIGITGALGSFVAGGSVTGTAATQSGCVSAHSVGAVRIGGDLVGGSGVGSGMIESQTTMGSVSIGGSILGGSVQDSGEVLAYGNIGAVKVGRDVRGGNMTDDGSFSGVIDGHGIIGSVTIGGSLIGGSGNGSDNGEIICFGASLGPVKIGRDVIGGSSAGEFSGLIDSHGTMASVTIGGSLIGGSGGLAASGAVLGLGSKVGPVKIGGDVVGGGTLNSGSIASAGSLASVTVGGSVIGGTNANTGSIFAAGVAGRVTINGDLRGGSVSGGASLDSTGSIHAKSIGSAFIGGSVISGMDTSTGTLTDSGSIRADDGIGNMTIRGSLIGNTASGGTTPVVISASGENVRGNIAIGGLMVFGGVDHANILAGYNASLTPTNGAASIGAVNVGGSWTASSLVAGAKNPASGNTNFGDANDVADGTGLSAAISKIVSISIGGAVSGTAAAGDHFGFVAEQIGSFRLGGLVIPLTPGAHNDNRPLGSTGDVNIHEVLLQT